MVEINEEKFKLHEFNGTDAYQMAFYIINMLNVSISSNINENFTVLCIRRLIELFCNPHVINDCGDALNPLSTSICKLMTQIKCNRQDMFIQNENFGIECCWDNIITNTPFLDNIFNEMVNSNNKMAPKRIFKYVIDNIINYDMIWNNSWNGSYILNLFCFQLKEREYYDDDEEQSQFKEKLLRKAIDTILFGDDYKTITDKQMKKEMLLNAVENVIKFHCGISERNEKENMAKIRMFQLRPYYGFEFYSNERAFWYYFYFYFILKQDAEQLFKEDENDEISVVERGYNDWNKNHWFKKDDDIYKKCMRSSMCKSQYEYWMT